MWLPFSQILNAISLFFSFPHLLLLALPSLGGFCASCNLSLVLLMVCSLGGLLLLLLVGSPITPRHPSFPDPSIPVVYEDAYTVIVAKPPGIPCSPQVGKTTPSVLTLLRRQHSEHNSEHTRLYQVHRLDAGTSGLLVYGKGRDAAGLLARGFANRSRDHQTMTPFLAKYYVAVTTRRPKKKMGTVAG